MSHRPRRVHGLAAILAAISDSALPRGEVAILKAMAEFCDWNTGENITATMESIAEKSHYKLRQATTHMRSLVRKGVVEIVAYRAGGRANIPIRRIDLRVLSAYLTEESESAGEPAAVPKGCNLRTERVQSVRAKGAIPAHNQEIHQTNPPPPVAGPPMRSAAGHQARLPAEMEEVVVVLLKCQVSMPKARAIASRLPMEVVKCGISHWRSLQRDGERAGTRVGVGRLVAVLEDGTAERRWQEHRSATARQRARDELTRRTAQVGVLMGALGEYRNCVDRRDELLRLERVVRSVWPTNEALAAAGVLTDDELAAARERPLELLATLEAEAGKHRAAEPGRAPWCAWMRGQAALGGRA